MRIEEKSQNFERKLEFDKFCQTVDRFELLFSNDNQGISKFYFYVDKMISAFQAIHESFHGKGEIIDHLQQPNEDLLHFAQALNQTCQFNKAQLMICEYFGITSEDLDRVSQNYSKSSQEILEKESESCSEDLKTSKIDFSDFIKALPKVEPSWKLDLKVQKLNSSISIKKEVLKFM